MSFMTLAADLKNIGFSDKEAAVYLAALGLGSGTVQQIARKAKVARATTYLVLDSLLEKGLMTKYTENNKTFFVASSPSELKRVLAEQEIELRENKEELKNLMPQLLAFLKSSSEKPVVRYYEGIEGLKTLRSEITMNTKPNEVWYQLSPVDHMLKIFDMKDVQYLGQRKAKRIKSKAIITTSSEKIKKELRESALSPWAERKFVDPKRYSSGSGMTVMAGKIAIVTFEKHIGGIVIESESAARMLQDLFDMAWESLA